MAKSIAKSCPLCLNVDDPAGMLPVMMTHSTPPQSAPMYLCRLCVLEIMKSAVASDLVDPREVFGDVTGGNELDLRGDSPGDDPGAADPLASNDEAAAGGTALDRPEPQMPGGKEHEELPPEKG